MAPGGFEITLTSIACGSILAGVTTAAGWGGGVGLLLVGCRSARYIPMVPTARTAAVMAITEPVLRLLFAISEAAPESVVGVFFSSGLGGCLSKVLKPGLLVPAA